MLGNRPAAGDKSAMHSLPLFMRLKDRPVMLLGDGEAAAAKRRLLQRAGAVIVGEEEQAALAIIAIEDGTEAEVAAARLKARGMLVNVVDRPALCDFTLPAIVDRDPVLIAIGTGGASAGLAKALRQRLELLLPDGLGALATALFGARQDMRTRWPDAADRRRAIDAALDPGGPLDLFGSMADGTVAGWLASPVSSSKNRLVAIHLRSVDPDEMTLSQARLLGQADRIFHAIDVPAAILDRARADAVRIAGDPPADPGQGLSIVLAMEKA